jgi:hypothetical protein
MGMQPSGAEVFDKKQRLMAYYELNPRFVAALDSVEERHESALRQALLGVQAWRGIEGRRLQGKKMLAPRLFINTASCIADLRALGDEWGPRCNWVASWLFYCLMRHLNSSDPHALGWLPVSMGKYNLAKFGILDDPMQGKALADFTLRGENLVRVEGLYLPFVTHARKRFETEILTQARRQMDGIERKYQEMLAWDRPDVKSSLALHIHWLYLRICPQEDIGRPWGFQMIAKAEEPPRPEKSTVQGAVLRLARELGITLPELPPGPAGAPAGTKITP